MTLDKRAQEAAQVAWGFVPGRDIKPVHLANGLGRAVCGGAGTPTLLQRAAAGARRADDGLSGDPDFLAHVQTRPGHALDPARTADLRRALDTVLNQDGALNKPGSPSSLTLTHRLHVTTDPSDNGAGAFLGSLLASGTPSPLLPVLRTILDDDGDTVSRLTGPLLDRSRTLGVEPRPEAAVTERLSASPVLRAVREGLDRLAAYADVYEKTAFLQRAVSFAAFGLVLHLANGRSTGRPSPLVPLLLVAPPVRPDERTRSQSAHDRLEREVREASRRTWVIVGREVRLAHEDGLRVFCQNRDEHRGDETYYRMLIERETDDPGARRPWKRAAERARSQFEAAFSRHLALGKQPFEAFVRSAVGPMATMMRATSGKSPEGCAGSLGWRSGLLWPRGGRYARYVRPDPRLLDALVSATLDPDAEAVTAAEFWQRLEAAYGLLSGDAGDFGFGDARRLAEWGVRTASSEALADNGRLLLGELVRLGYARRYADGVALVEARR